MFDGICDQTRKLKSVSGTMPNDEIWVISSLGIHMFVSFYSSNQGFSANIHYGNEIDKFAHSRL